MSKANVVEWSLPLSSQPRVTLFLKGAAGYVRWTAKNNQGSEIMSTMLSPFDDQGIMQPELMVRLVRVGAAMAAAVARDKSPEFVEAARERALAMLDAPVASLTLPGGWGLKDGIEHYFSHPGTSSKDQRADERRAVERLLPWIRQEAHIEVWAQLDWPAVQKGLKAWADNTLAELRRHEAGMAPATGRQMKANAASTGLPYCSTAKRAAMTLVRIASWLHAQKPESGASPLTVENVSQDVQKIWQSTFQTGTKGEKPRHDPLEYQRLIVGLYDPATPIDPRARLAFLMNVERRTGQVRRVMRTDITMEHGRPFAFRISATGNKKTNDLYLFVDRAAEELELALTSGYLCKYEEAYKQGKIKNYPIFLQGKLTDEGYIRFDPKKLLKAPYNERSLLEEFRALEKHCNIEPIPGRGWYGLKRLAADLLDQLTEDEELKNRFFSHDSTATRDIYRQVESRIRREAQKLLLLQQQMRKAATHVEPAASASGGASTP